MTERVISQQDYLIIEKVLDFLKDRAFGELNISINTNKKNNYRQALIRATDVEQVEMPKATRDMVIKTQHKKNNN